MYLVEELMSVKTLVKANITFLLHFSRLSILLPGGPIQNFMIVPSFICSTFLNSMLALVSLFVILLDTTSWHPGC